MSETTLDPVRALLDEAARLSSARQYAEAELRLGEALSRLDAAGVQDHPFRAYALYSLRSLYLAQRRFPEALRAGEQELALLERQFGPEDPRLADPVEALAFTHYQLRNWEEATPWYERALELYRRAGPPARKRAASALADYGKVFHRQGRHAEAEQRYRASLQLLEPAETPEPQAGDTLYHLGAAVAAQGRLAEAEPLLVRALKVCEASPPLRFPLQAMVLAELVRVLEALRRPLEAEAYARQAVALTESTTPPGHPARADALRDLGRTLPLPERLAEAYPVLASALEAAEQSHGPRSPFTAAALHNLAGAHFHAGKWDEAAALEQRALAIYEEQSDKVGPALADSLRCLARVRERQGRTAEAQELAARAQALGLPQGAGGALRIPLPPEDT